MISLLYSRVNILLAFPYWSLCKRISWFLLALLSMDVMKTVCFRFAIQTREYTDLSQDHAPASAAGLSAR